jgi:glycerate kinase
LVFTGEGRIDAQTAFGKTPFGVAQIAGNANIPVVAIAGGLGIGYQELYTKGFHGIFSLINGPMSLDEAITRSEELLENIAESVVRFRLSFK